MARKQDEKNDTSEKNATVLPMRTATANPPTIKAITDPDDVLAALSLREAINGFSRGSSSRVTLTDTDTDTLEKISALAAALSQGGVLSQPGEENAATIEAATSQFVMLNREDEIRKVGFLEFRRPAIGEEFFRTEIARRAAALLIQIDEYVSSRRAVLMLKREREIEADAFVEEMRNVPMLGHAIALFEQAYTLGFSHRGSSALTAIEESAYRAMSLAMSLLPMVASHVDRDVNPHALRVAIVRQARARFAAAEAMEPAAGSGSSAA